MSIDEHSPRAPVALADCWNRIGVSGDQSCDKLAGAVHCRNCDVYAGAAQRNLQRPVTEGYREQWASHFSRARDVPMPADSAALVFRIGREWLALPAALVDSVAPLAPGHRLPHRSGGGLAGIVNVGGKLLPSISLATVLGIAEGDAPQAGGRHIFPRLVIMLWEGQAFALPVADLHGIVRYASSAAAAPAATINKGLGRFLTGVLSEGSMRIGVLDATLVGHQMARLLR